MKLMIQFDGVFLGATSQEWKNFEKNTSGMSYKVSVMQNGGVGQLRCEKEVFEMYNSGQIVEMVAAVFVATIDDKYNQLKVIAVQPRGSKS